MSKATPGMNCAVKCWISAAVVAVVTLVMLLGLGNGGVVWPLVIAAVIFVALGLAFRVLLCGASADLTAPAPETAAAKPAPTPTPASEPVPASPATAAVAKTEAERAAGAAATAGETAGGKPAGLSAPHGGKADDLKQIKGVGPKLETMLNEMGFYHFDQIAGWGPAEVAWVDENLQGFKGRVSRDDWVAQAKTLASGGETAFSKRVEDGDVY